MTDYQYIDTTGEIVPDTSTILGDVETEYKAALGADLIVDPSTPQGVLIAAEALARSEVVNNNAAIANQINPNIASGVFLDALLALTGMQRTTATPTVVSGVAVTGVAGTVISQGSQAKTSAGDLFGTASTITLDSGGNGIVDFNSVVSGPIPCAAHALSTIVTNILGWETVDNANAGTLGTATQNDQAARALRSNTLAFQGVSLAVAITSALYAVPGVTSLFFQENIANTDETINDIAMVPHSVYVCVNGGTDNDVATALLENKSSGAAWNGGTAVTVTEPASGQNYTVLFDRPTSVSVVIRVTTSNGNTGNIIQAVLDYANGLINGLAGFVVGADVSPFEISSAIISRFPNYYISKVEVSLASSISYSTNTLPIGINEIAFTQSSYVTVVIS